jgi:Ser/Thr protein kinase RdoA (MazF antagonist)
MKEVIEILNDHYSMAFDRLELIRDMGSTAYAAFSGRDKYFLRMIKPAFFDTAIAGADIQVFLQKQGFPVPPILFTKQGLPYSRTDAALIILYEYIEGNDCDPDEDAEAIGELVGRLHRVMKAYPGELVKRDKHFYIGRYINTLKRRHYPRAEEYIAYGEALWEKIHDLPRGYCHGDMYDGNIRKAIDGKLYLHDFDTSCEGFPMYDPTLICDRTKYFEFDELNFSRSNKILARFVPEYRKHNALVQAEIDAFHALIALQHFSTQATVMELYGSDCLSDQEIGNQLDWLYRWREQYVGSNSMK